MATLTWQNNEKLKWSYYYLPEIWEVTCKYEVGPNKTSSLTWPFAKGQLVRLYTGATSPAQRQWDSPNSKNEYCIERCPKIGGYWNFYPNDSDREKEAGYIETVNNRFGSQIGWVDGNKYDIKSLIPASWVGLPASKIDYMGGENKPVPKKWWFLSTAKPSKGDGGNDDSNGGDDRGGGDDSGGGGNLAPAASTSWLPVVLVGAAAAWFFLRRK